MDRYIITGDNIQITRETAGGGTAPVPTPGPAPTPQPGGSTIPLPGNMPDVTGSLRSGSGQWKAELPLPETGIGGLAFRMPSGGFSTPWGGRINAEPSNGTPPQSFVWVVHADGNEVFRAENNSLSVDTGSGSIQGAVMLPPGSAVQVSWSPVAPLQRSASGVAAILAEVMLPARGSAFVW